MMTVSEEIEQLRAQADEAFATSNIDGMGEVLVDLLDLMLRLIDGHIEVRVISVQTVDIKGHEKP
jgi:hypothetical protein